MIFVLFLLSSLNIVPPMALAMTTTPGKSLIPSFLQLSTFGKGLDADTRLSVVGHLYDEYSRLIIEDSDAECGPENHPISSELLSMQSFLRWNETEALVETMSDILDKRVLESIWLQVIGDGGLQANFTQFLDVNQAIDSYLNLDLVKALQV